MAESCIVSLDLYEMDKDFFTTFSLQPEKVINIGMCGEIVLATTEENTGARRVLKKVTLLDEETNPKRVVKIFTLLDQETNARNRQIFQAEVQFMQSFDHPYLMKCLIAGQCPDYLAICMHYYQRGTLRHYLGDLSLELSELCVTQVACALRYLHKNHVAHVDVKLENILMDDNFNAILGDFGLAVKMSPDQQTLPKRKCGGTPCYFAPERIGAPADKELDPYKLDSYCLGVVFWALVSEREPSSNLNYYFETRKNGELPPNVRNWLLQLLERNPERRVTVLGFLVRLRRDGVYRFVIDRN